jgi:hypothetical protein
MDRVASSHVDRRAANEPLYDVDPRTGAAVEVFYADDVLAKSFGTHTGWFWWSCRRGFLPDGQPTGPFGTSYAAYRNIASRWVATSFGHRRGAHVAAR